MGAFHSKLRNKPGLNAWIPTVLLPIPPTRLDKLPDYPLEAHKLDALQVVHDIVSLIFSPPADSTGC